MFFFFFFFFVLFFYAVMQFVKIIIKFCQKYILNTVLAWDLKLSELMPLSKFGILTPLIYVCWHKLTIGSILVLQIKVSS